MSVLYISNPSTNKPLEQKLLDNAEYKQQYLDRICNLLNTQFDTTHLYLQVDSLSNWIRPSVYADNKKFFPNNQFEQNLTTDVGNVAGLKSFLQTRIASVKTEMASFGCTVTALDETFVGRRLGVFPNPTQGPITISGATKNLKIYNAVGSLVLQTRDVENGLVGIDVADLPPGFYTIHSNGLVAKFVKQ